jgi:hypothetical protein
MNKLILDNLTEVDGHIMMHLHCLIFPSRCFNLNCCTCFKHTFDIRQTSFDIRQTSFDIRQTSFDMFIKYMKVVG